MKTPPHAISSVFRLIPALLCFSAAPLRAEQFGLFTYQVVLGTEIKITDYPDNATGAVILPAEIDGKPVTSIGYNAFSDCIGLTSVTIPSSVTRIDGYAFLRCRALTSVTIPASVTAIGDHAFYDCSGLSSLTIPSSVITIGEWAFAQCYGLTSLNIEQGVTSIGNYAFAGCDGLTSVSIPASVTDMTFLWFLGCTGLTPIHVDPGNPTYASAEGVLFDAARTTILYFPGAKSGTYAIPPSVSQIGAGAFNYCAMLTGMTIPSSVNNIAGYAFYGCTGLNTLIIASGVTSIGDSAFYSCTGLTSVNIPSSVTSIGNTAFGLCTGLTSVTIAGSGISLANAFDYCNGLKRAIFLGHAPIQQGGWFAYATQGFTVYYLSSKSGFTSPTWYSYPATMINEATYPAASWLLAHDLWYNTSLHQDPDGDGVDLLLAYALNLDPRLNLQSSLPVAVHGANTLSLSFHETSPGITYHVETSTDLQNWSTAGVTQSLPGPDQKSTATVARDGPRRFLRLLVAD